MTSAQSSAEPNAADQTSAAEERSKAVEAILSTVNSVAQRIQALWITFLSFGAYVAITVLGTTHRMLLLEDPVKLPLFNIDLPLTSFYVLAPMFFLIFHFYLVVQLILLARTANEFLETLEHSGMTPTAIEAVRMRLDNSVFVQLLAGAPPERSGKNAWLIRPLAWLTVIVLPIALLLLIQLQFLPYHDEQVTWFHRVTLALDLMMLMMLWPAYSRGCGIISKQCLLPGFADRAQAYATVKTLGLLICASVLIVLACFVAAFPTEAVYSRNFLTRALFERGVDRVSGRPLGYLSNRLVAPDQAFVDDKQIRELDAAEGNRKPGKHRIVRSFRGRDLAFAVLAGSDLRRSDFTGANMEGVDLSEASLDRSRFGSIEEHEAPALDSQVLAGAVAFKPVMSGQFFDRPRRGITRLVDAKLGFAQLSWVSFDRAILTRAILESANLEGASLEEAHLQRADLTGARMPGAVLREARLVGAQLDGADLRFAMLREADLRMASLEDSRMHAATLTAAKLQGASLRGAEMFGALLASAQLQGAQLVETQMQGTSLANADVDGAVIDGSYVWRVNAARIKGRFIQQDQAADVKMKAMWLRPPEPATNAQQTEDISTDAVTRIRTRATEGFSEKLRLPVSSLRLETLNPETPPSWTWDEGHWQTILSNRLKGEEADKIVVEILRAAVCDEDGAPHVAEAFVRSTRWYDLGPLKKGILAAMKDRNTCLGARGLNKDDLTLLED